MATIQPEEIPGLPELFAEVKALRQELERLKAGMPSGPTGLHAVAPRIADEPADRSEAHNAESAISMSPDDIRERVGEVVGERRTETPSGAASALGPQP